MDADVAEVLGGIRQALIGIQETAARNHAELKEDLGDVKEQTTKHNTRMTKLEAANERKAGAEEQRNKSAKRLYGVLTLLGIVFGGGLATVAVKLVGG